jgi:hypothetical protein
MKAAGIFFVIGLILAASYGPWFPWINFAGVIVFGLSPVLAWRADRMRG